MEYKRYLSGGLSGIIEVFATHPIDYVKTKRQEYYQKNLKITSNFHKEITNGRITNYYRGVVPRTIGVAPMRFVFWGVQDTTNLFLLKKQIRSNFNFAIVGSTAGFAQTIIDNQIEILKIKQMSKSKLTPKDFFSFKGFKPTLLRNIGFACSISYFCFNKKGNNDIHKFCRAAVGGLIGSVLTQPLDYVKTLQHRTNNSDSTLYILKETIKDNPKKLFTGGLYRSTLCFFGMGIGFLSYEKINKLIFKN